MSVSVADQFNRSLSGYVSFAEMARELGKHPSVIQRWRSPGIKVADGTRRRLAAWRVGGTWMTTRSAVAEFIDACTAGCDRPSTGTDVPRSPAEARRSYEAAERELDVEFGPK
jgi:hypothetical protein